MRKNKIKYWFVLLCWLVGGVLLQGAECEVKILGMAPEKNTYGIGEAMKWFYCYEGPVGQKDYHEQWFCRKKGEEWQVLFGKPEALFEKGEYEIGLQLRDGKGKWSPMYIQVVEIDHHIICEELAYSGAKQVIGSCVENLSKTNYRGYPEIPYELHQSEEGTLILSNSPEEVKEEGILYRSFFNGDGTLFVHHIQGFADLQRRGVVVKVINLASTSVKLEVEHKAFKGPDKNVVWMGQSVLLDYFGKRKWSTHVIGKGDCFVLYREEKWRQKDVISALMGIKTDGPVMIEVSAYKPGAEHGSREPLEKDVHPRGSFYGGNREYRVLFRENDGIRTLVLGKPSEWLCGKDAMTGEVVTNKGNYGVPHVLDVAAEESIDLFLNPRGDMFKGAICWDDQEVYAIPTKGCLRNQQKLIYLGHIEKGENRKLIYMLPSASAAPVIIVFVPSQGPL